MPRLRLEHVALFPAAIAAGLGLGLAALAALSPAVPVAILAPVSPLGPPAPPQTVAAQPAPEMVWPALFGIEAQPVPEPEPEPEPIDDLSDEDLFDLDFPPDEVFEEEQGTAYDIDSLILRGLVWDGAGGGTAIIETPEGQITVTRGDFLPDGAYIAEIRIDTVDLDFNGDFYTLEFRLAPPRPAPNAPVSPLVRSRTDAQDDASLDDSEFPVYIGEDDGLEPPQDNFGLSR